MTSADCSILIHEWETRGPANCDLLKGRFLDSSSGVKETVKQFKKNNFLVIRELRQGLEIEARSYVGRLRIGDLNLLILPKIKGESLIRLIRYAYGFRNLNLLSDSVHFTDQMGFEDLLICQLNSEVQDLIRRGIHRSYISKNERLSSPRGKINLTELVKDSGFISATIPCTHYPRITDTLLNQTLLAGLNLAASMASAIEIGRKSRQLASILQEGVTTVRLDRSTLSRAMSQLNRLTASYSSALKVIQLLVEAQGISLKGEITGYRLPGFLFDMNAVFQALLSRFLRENLDGYSVQDEYSLRDLMKYDPEFNPKCRQPPTPRPDYVITQNGKIKAVLDAKYRDLWQKPIPREMLYQLVIYAISHSKTPRSTILYPTMNNFAKEARIDISDLSYGNQIGQVCIRPVHMPTLLGLTIDHSSRGRTGRKALAIKLAFGADSRESTGWEGFTNIKNQRDVKRSNHRGSMPRKN